MNPTIHASSVIMHMRRRYSLVTEKIELKNAKSDPFWAMRDYLFQKYEKQVKLNEHFMLRLYQRYTPEERSKILAEIASLLKSGMQLSLLPGKKKGANIVIGNGSTLCIEVNERKRLIIKTIFKGTGKADVH